MIGGTIYGTVLNDAREREQLAGAFNAPPYRAPPAAPVLYIKPRGCLAPSGGQLEPEGLPEITAAATIGLIFARDTVGVSARRALDNVAEAALVLDLAEPRANYYRPAVRQRCRDGFLRSGTAIPFHPRLLDGEILTQVDGVDAHRWSAAQLVRDPAHLIADISTFMTLAAGDMLLIGLAHDAPRIRPGQRAEAMASGFAPVSFSLSGER